MMGSESITSMRHTVSKKHTTKLRAVFHWFLPVFIITVFVSIFSLIAFAASKGTLAVLMPRGQIAQQQLELIMFTVALGSIVIIPVFVMLGVFAYRYRANNAKAVYTPEIEGNRMIEAVWWVIPIIIIAILSVVTWVSTHSLDPYKPLTSSKSPLTVEVISLQWRWLFLYPEHGVASMNHLSIPNDTPINFRITADGPMSAFWVPQLGSQIYAMNGMTTKLSLMADEAGTYYGSNSNISGEGYSKMRFSVDAISNEAFLSWINKSSKSQSTLNWDTYQSIKKPTQDMTVTQYKLTDANLFDRITSSYMSDHMSDEVDTIDTGSTMHESMGH